jgi:tripartite-type tricarboxylate transporter receptor subunit TctC
MQAVTRAWVLGILWCGGLHASSTSAQPYPSKPIRFLVGFAPGGASDITSRILAQKVTEQLGQPVVVDNRAGASGAIAARIVAKAAPDGYTLLSGATSILAINPGLTPNLDYDALRDFTPVSQTVSMAQLLVVHPGVKAVNLQELIALAKAKPGELMFSSSGSGSSSHLAMELFMYMTGTKAVHVPYKGSGQSMPALIGGQVQIIFDPIPTSLPHVRTGKLRALAISTARRSPAIPELTTVAEAGVPGYESSLWYGVLLPAGAPASLVARLNSTLAVALRTPDLVERFTALGADAVATSPAQFAEYMKVEHAKWGRLIKAAGIRAE